MRLIITIVLLSILLLSCAEPPTKPQEILVGDFVGDEVDSVPVIIALDKAIFNYAIFSPGKPIHLGDGHEWPPIEPSIAVTTTKEKWRGKQPDPIEPACNYDPIEYSVGFKITEATSTSLYITDSLGNPQGYVIICGGELHWMPLQ